MLVASPSKPFRATVAMPGDKSISHRAVILGSLCQGTVHVENFLTSEDCLHSVKAMRQLGINIELDKQQLTIHGRGLEGLRPSAVAIDCGNSGTLMRLLAGVLAGQAFDSLLVGDQSLSARPMDRIIEPLSQMGAIIESQSHRGKQYPPLHIHGRSDLRGIHYKMPIASAQVKSALMLATLFAQGQSLIEGGESARDHTERMLRLFGLTLEGDNQRISMQSQPLKPAPIVIPGDISSAAFFMVAATLIPDTHLLIKNVGLNETRTGVIHILRQMGADIRIQPKESFEPVGDIEIRYAPLKGIEIPSEWIVSAIDEFPIIFIAASFASGETVLHKAKELRVKEVDRIEVMANNLRACGIKLETYEDGLKIHGGGFKGALVDSMGDHRVAMAFAIAGCCADEPVKIKNYACIDTSFPSFIEVAKSCGLELTLEESL